MTRPIAPVSPLAALAFVTSIATAIVGCGRPPPGGVVIFTASSPELSMASIDPETGSWESAPWSPGETGWIPYPPRGQIQVEHGLERVPRVVLVYLSFDRSGAAPGLAAGDLARIVDADERTITIWNDTNGSFFARVVAR
ncbi:MAG: hypothetical protein OHK0013_07440 [Sandaracinaceae bacterium]